ncbi:hypothetical protein FPOA_04008 [Fusarium poae]|uniref:F-box domain-containing protein n=1 Tax=Fusarium poae TaxID=36050 RepID=A0A1B8ASF4_FUSPO|nr:hypothetical protein FPOA_04008 [Fusarium poae]
MKGSESPPASLSTLPVELGHHIARFLANRDIKSLRLTSSSLRARFTLCLKRVFISASPRNLKVVKEVADHEVFRHGVTEIIWDESEFQYTSSKLRTCDWDWGYYLDSCREDICELAGGWTNADLTGRPDDATRQLAAAMSRDECEQLYSELADEEECILKSGEDIKVFEYALDRFPLLRRVTISTKAHGRLFMPMYETPMIRSFPYGFVYHLPDLSGQSVYGYDSSLLWEDEQSGNRPKYTVHRRGVCSSLRMLARHERHKVSEFIIEDLTRINWIPVSKFDNKGYALADLKSLIQRPGFSRLHLFADDPKGHEILEKVENLRSLRICGRWSDAYLQFPRCVMQSLQNLELDKLELEAHNFMTFVGPLNSLRSLQLRYAIFSRQYGVEEETDPNPTGNPHEFLNALKENDWCSRSSRPKVTIELVDGSWYEGQMLRLDSDVDEFLYENGENPFVPDKFEVFHGHSYFVSQDMDKICEGKGIEVDEYDPEYERPNFDDETRERLGIASTHYRRDKPWGDSEWGPQTCPKLEEQDTNPHSEGPLELAQTFGETMRLS